MVPTPPGGFQESVNITKTRDSLTIEQIQKINHRNLKPNTIVPISNNNR